MPTTATRTRAVVVILTIAVAACGSPRESIHRPGGENDGIEPAVRALAPQAAVGLLKTEDGTRQAAVGRFIGGRRARPQDLFNIASMTKTYTATVVLQLVEEGRLSLMDTVEEVLPGVLPYGERISIRHLLNHTSGLTDVQTFGASPSELLDTLASTSLAARPGARHSYANVNYVLLGVIVERVTGESLDRVVLDRIFLPLGLDHSRFGGSGAMSLDEAAWLGAAQNPSAPVAGDGGIVSTTEDVATFFGALLSGDLIDAGLLSEMTRTVPGPEGLRAGLGIFEVKLSCENAFGHGGDMPLYSSMALASQDGSRVVVVAQASSGWEHALDVASEIYCS